MNGIHKPEIRPQKHCQKGTAQDRQRVQMERRDFVYFVQPLDKREVAVSMLHAWHFLRLLFWLQRTVRYPGNGHVTSLARHWPCRIALQQTPPLQHLSAAWALPLLFLSLLLHWQRGLVSSMPAGRS